MEHSDEKLLKIVNREFKWKTPILVDNDPLFNSNNYQFKIHFVDYCNNIPSEEISLGWKLINRVIRNGYIHLNRYELIRFIAQVLIKELKHRSKEYHPEYEESINLNETSPVSINEGAFPPCIKKLVIKADKGIFLGHHERLLLANFLNMIKYPINDIIEIFRFQSDFDPRISAYFIRYSRRNQNKPHNCTKIKTFGNICESDNSCKKWMVKNPLNYYFKRTPQKDIPQFKRSVEKIPKFKRVKRPK